MPKEYIERRSARKQLQKEAEIAEYKGVIHHVVPVCAIDKIPAADVVEVVHGEWIGTHDGWYYSYSCSECGAEALTKEETMHDQVCSAYCPDCGAKMDGERRD